MGNLCSVMLYKLVRVKAVSISARYNIPKGTQTLKSKYLDNKITCIDKWFNKTLGIVASFLKLNLIY